MEGQCLDLGDKCTIIKSEDIHQKMEALLASDQEITIDASKVEQIDTASLQLLTCFYQALSTDGRVPKWNSPSEQTLLTAKLLGLDEHLGLSKAE